MMKSKDSTTVYTSKHRGFFRYKPQVRSMRGTRLVDEKKMGCV
jgi:hypothetical protein